MTGTVVDDPAPHSSAVIVEAFGCTDPGRVRPANEDFLLIGDLDTGTRWTGDEPFVCRVAQRGPLFIVCDGLGGTAAGEVASELAAETIWDEMKKAQEARSRAVYARLLRRAVRVANRRVWDTGKRDSKLRGMGTTVSAAGLVGGTLVLAQVGDSRAYVMRNQTLVQVTRDQSVAAALMRSGNMTEDEARAVPGSNMVLQALGGRHNIEVALSVVELRRGDRLLVCSDGLHGAVADPLLQNFLSVGADVGATADLLIEAACMAGGPDNITVVVAGFDGDGLAPPDSELPCFTELDPMEEGDRSLVTTSVIGQRLAARAGLGTDPGDPVVPDTNQHTAIRLPGATKPGRKRGKNSTSAKVPPTSGGVPGTSGGVPGTSGEGRSGEVPAASGGVPPTSGEGPGTSGEGRSGGVPATSGGVPVTSGEGRSGGVPATSGEGRSGGVPATSGGVPATSGLGNDSRPRWVLWLAVAVLLLLIAAGALLFLC